MKKLLSIILTLALMLTVLPLTAQTAYAAAPKVKITWNANGGKIGTKTMKTVSYTKGKKIGKLQTAKRTGYTFKGWYTKKSAGTKVTKNTKATKKATYYAQWTAKQYTLTFNANGGSVTPASRKVAYKKGYGTLPTPRRDGYTFQGWYTAASGGTKVSAMTKMVAKNVTVYAQWKKDQRVLTDAEKAFVGSWLYQDTGLVTGTNSSNLQTFGLFIFANDGTYEAKFVNNNRVGYISVARHSEHEKGQWRVSGGKVYFTSITYSESNDLKQEIWTAWKARDEYSINTLSGSDSIGQFFQNTETNFKYYKDRKPQSGYDYFTF